MHDALIRIADALERIAPQPAPAPPADAAAYLWDGSQLQIGALLPLSIDLLTGIDLHKAALLENTARHAARHAAHDVLLWGARGAGKSALAKACVAAVQVSTDLAWIELMVEKVDTLPRLFETLEAMERPVVVFVDDLGFDGDVAAARALRSVLDGGSRPRPPHVRLYVTSNRRHIVARDIAEQESAINARDVVDDRLALADRFGLSLGFHRCDQDTYLAIVKNYATAFALPFDAQDAVAFATQRGSRSGRVAWHYLVDLAGRAERAL